MVSVVLRFCCLLSVASRSCVRVGWGFGWNGVGGEVEDAQATEVWWGYFGRARQGSRRQEILTSSALLELAVMRSVDSLLVLCMLQIVRW
jgi:hypothetical protein